MTVLWFSNTPALGVNYLNNNSTVKGTGGWLHSLNSNIQSIVNLSVVFHYPYKIEPFVFQNTKYYPVFTGNIILENLKSRFSPLNYDDDFIEKYIEIINNINPDIIHIHGTENSFLCIIEKIKKPVVVSIQGNITVITKKYFSGFEGKYLKLKANKFNLKSLLLGRNNFNKSFKSMLKKSIIEQQRMGAILNIIGRTDWDYRITRILSPKSHYFKGEELLRDGFYNNSWNNFYTTGKLILFTTNGDTYYKGFETALHALSLLQSIGLDVEWRIAGVSDSSLINKITKKYLKNLYPKVGLNLLGSISEEPLISNMLDSHIYVMPSHIENSPNNLCEAMMLGMPCVATFAGGTGSLLKDGEDGILIQDGDPWAMAGAIIELVNSPEKSTTFANNARKKAQKRHDIKETVNQYLSIYTKIINAHKQ